MSIDLVYIAWYRTEDYFSTDQVSPPRPLSHHLLSLPLTNHSHGEAFSAFLSSIREKKNSARSGEMNQNRISGLENDYVPSPPIKLDPEDSTSAAYLLN